MPESPAGPRSRPPPRRSPPRSSGAARPRRAERDRAARQLRRRRHGRVRHRLAHREQAPQARRGRRRGRRPRTGEVKKKFPDCQVYQDWRELLDKEKDLDSVNVSTPDHMHAPITMRAMHRGLHVYTQKPLTQTIYEARRLDGGRGREEARHADGHPDPLATRATSSS